MALFNGFAGRFFGFYTLVVRITCGFFGICALPSCFGFGSLRGCSLLLGFARCVLRCFALRLKCGDLRLLFPLLLLAFFVAVLNGGSEIVGHWAEVVRGTLLTPPFCLRQPPAL